MALYYTKGTICEMTEVQSGTSKSGFEWQRMTIVLEVPGYQGAVTKQAFNVSNQDIKEASLFSIGDKVEVSWAMYAREWNGKWYNSVDLARIKHQEVKVAPDPALPKTEVAVQEILTSSDEGKDDLPF